MTADERLEALLNRAGQTISDLPTQYSLDMETVTIDAAADSGFGWLEDYICHLADVIDRMETALENVIGERDWLVRHAPDIEIECDLCVHRENTSQPPCDTCTLPPGPNYFEYAGVPEDWRADNETD